MRYYPILYGHMQPALCTQTQFHTRLKLTTSDMGGVRDLAKKSISYVYGFMGANCAVVCWLLASQRASFRQKLLTVALRNLYYGMSTTSKTFALYQRRVYAITSCNN